MSLQYRCSCSEAKPEQIISFFVWFMSFGLIHMHYVHAVPWRKHEVTLVYMKYLVASEREQFIATTKIKLRHRCGNMLHSHEYFRRLGWWSVKQQSILLKHPRALVSCVMCNVALPNCPCAFCFLLLSVLSDHGFEVCFYIFKTGDSTEKTDLNKEFKFKWCKVIKMKKIVFGCVYSDQHSSSIIFSLYSLSCKFRLHRL